MWVTPPLGTRGPALAASTIPPLSVRPCGTRFSNTQEGPNRCRSAPITDPLFRGFGIPNRERSLIDNQEVTERSVSATPCRVTPPLVARTPAEFAGSALMLHDPSLPKGKSLNPKHEILKPKALSLRAISRIVSQEPLGEALGGSQEEAGMVIKERERAREREVQEEFIWGTGLFIRQQSYAA